MSAEFQLQELAELVGLLCDDRIDDEQFARLEQLLRDSAAARQAYHVLVATHVRLTQLDASAFAGDSKRPAKQSPLATVPGRGAARSRTRMSAILEFIRREPVLSVISALAVMIVVAAVLQLLPGTPRERIAKPNAAPPAQHVAQIVNLSEAVWSNPRDYRPRETLLFPGDELALQSGLVEVRHHSGAIVVIEGPVRYVVDNRNSGSLPAGKLIARVSSAASGFVVSTPHAKITDLGTKFGVAVDPEGETHAHVFTGKVQFAPHKAALDAAPRVVTLSAGSGIVFNAQGQRRTEPSAPVPQFVHQLPSLPAGDDSQRSFSLLQYRRDMKAVARADASWTIGVLFAVGDEPLELTHLGVQDVDAASDAHDPDGADNLAGFADDDGFVSSPISVGLWSADDGQLVASAQVRSDDPVIGSWRYAELAGERVVLTPNKQYVVGAYVGGGIEWFLDGEGSQPALPFTNNLRLRVLENRYQLGAFTFPQTSGKGHLGRWGAANALFQPSMVTETKPSP